MQDVKIIKGDRISIYTNGVLFYEGKEVTPRALQTLLLFLGFNAKLEDSTNAKLSA